ncbi:signal transduction histidine kinase, LytS [Bacteroides helcogenes P 36-108]|uniref:Signal transduction histidine kinase, LytS n=2 Tax=Bacteroides helcogenes TaxID=290053 RepID=E6SR60_BACT6|nr:signal transduction histidine kinase, LytS [Bacteroides helcogenes P 36-108]
MFAEIFKIWLNLGDMLKKVRRIAWLYSVCMGIGAMALHSCTAADRKTEDSELKAFHAFYAEKVDSISVNPRKVRTEVLQRMCNVRDSLVHYNYLALVLKTCLATSDIDSAGMLIRRIGDFTKRQPFSPQLADLQSENLNMEGNIYARTGYMDSAIVCFQKAYELRMHGEKKDMVADILINLADACNRSGKLDVGASWYRRALLLCDSLGISSAKKTPVYYGLAQIYVALRDFEQCDHYYDLASRSYSDMLPFEKHFYLNNRGTSYYYRGDYNTAVGYFRQVIRLTQEYPDMVFEANLGRLNLGDCFLQLDEADSAAFYINKCRPFFQKIGMTTALYYIDTQDIKLALLRKDLLQAQHVLAEGITPADIDPDMVHIRNKYLQQFSEEAGNYKRAYYYLKENNHLDDSIRNERVKMRTADLALRYQQDSTVMAQKVFIQEKENEVLVLKQTRIFWIAVCAITLLVIGFVYMYSKKKRALLLAQNYRTVSMLRLENIRNRLSPHFIFNVLNQEMAERKAEEQQGLASLVKLMRRNLELAEQLCVTLAEELDFVKTYIDLERRSLGTDFHPVVEIGVDVYPEKVLLPSMLIQIPVENAIKHALRGKEGERNLWISACRQKDGIRIRITDNGGGYRLNSRNRGTGTGMKVVMQTIQILNRKNKEGIDVAIHNVTLPTGETGCEVTFLLPEKYNYNIEK